MLSPKFLLSTQHSALSTHSSHSLMNAPIFSDKQSTQMKGEKYIIFCLGAKFFAVPSKKVSEVVQRLSITPLPNVPGWLLGIADLRGGIISIVSLQKLLGAPDAALSSKSKFIVLKIQDFPASVALAVDRLSEIIVLPNEEIQPVESKKMPLLLGQATYQSYALNLLNVDNLLASLTI